MIVLPLVMAVLLAQATSCPTDAVSRDFLDYLDHEILHYCEDNTDNMSNRTALIQCIKVRYHSLKATKFHGNFTALSDESMNKLEGYFADIVKSCWDDSLSHSEFNDCVGTTYYVTYNYTDNHLQGDISKEFLDFLKCNLLIPCETDPNVPSDNRHALVQCIRDSYHQMKANGFSAEFSSLTPDSLDSLEKFFAGVVTECWDDSISHAQFNKCVGNKYYHNYEYNQRRLVSLLARFLRTVRK
ncbi:uncharacterized protein [Argopecten irradians]|uniref:uncharacterized protein n=1 Tax=Argopecten irradians TaxID=31199 RepID=UPI003722D2F1